MQDGEKVCCKQETFCKNKNKECLKSKEHDDEKDKNYIKKVLLKADYCLLCCDLPVFWAGSLRGGPQNPVVQHGSFVPGSFDPVGGNTWNITQTTSQAIVNYSGFNVAGNEVINFLRQGGGGDFAILNRILSASPTTINGQMNSLGRVFFVNPAGVLFGNNASINVAQLVASSLNISNENFLNGRFEFAGGNGSVINRGNITADKVALIGKKVLNTGTISSPGGLVIMAAGDRVLLGQPGSNVLVEVASVNPSAVLSDGLFDGDVVNEGAINAQGGKVVLAAGDTYSRAIDGLEGLSVAVGSGTGRVGQFGTINVNGIEGNGGSITLTAGDVVALNSDSVTTANAGANGNGGAVIVYSPDTAIFAEGARIEAKGGSESGNGGFAEVSGKQSFEIWGLVDTTAPYGAIGTFLIDPTNITIGSSNTSSNMLWHASTFQYYQDGGTQNPNRELKYTTLENQLASSNVEVLANQGGTAGADGWIEVEHSINWSSNNSLTLTATAKASSYIGIYDPITNTGSGNLTLNAGGYIDIDRDISLNGGSLTADAGQTGGSSTIYIGDDIRAGGNITLKDNVILNGSGSSYRNQDILADGTLWAWGTITKNNEGDVVLKGGTQAILDGEVTIDDSLTLNGGNVTTTGNGNLSLTAGKDITTNAPISLAGSGNVTLKADDNITINNDIETAGGNIELFADYDGDAKGDMYAGYDKDTDTASDVPITAGGNIDIRGNDVRLGGAVTATGGNLTITGRDCDGDHGTKWGDIWAYNTLNAGGDIEIMATGREWVDTHHSGYWEYSPGTIHLYDNVTAGGNLMLRNDTYTYNSTGNGVRLQAGLNVILAEDGIPNSEFDNCTFLKGLHNLEIVALGLDGIITNESAVFNGILPLTDGAPLTKISVDGSSLLMQQVLSIDTKDFWFDKQATTNLTLISKEGSVTSDLANTDNAADEWASIGATAEYDITLTGDDEIRLAKLEAMQGDIEVVTSKGDIVGSGDITAHQGKVSITSEDDDIILGSPGIPVAVSPVVTLL